MATVVQPIKSVAAPAAKPEFPNSEFVACVDAETKLRIGMLCVLYSRKRSDPQAGGMTMLDVENVMKVPREQLLFAAWYLKTRKFVLMDDRSLANITAEGIDYLEEQLPKLRQRS